MERAAPCVRKRRQAARPRPSQRAPSRRFSPVNFKDVTITGDVLARAARHGADARRSRASTSSSRENGILESLTIPNPPPPLRIPIRASRPDDPGFLGLRRRQVDRDRELRPELSARRDDRAADRGDHRPARRRAASGRLSELLVHRARDREPLDQSPRQARALLRRPPARRRHRLFRRDRAPAAARHHDPLRRPHRRDLRHRPGPEAGLLRASGDRAGAGEALPRHRRAKASRPRRLFRRPAGRIAALFRHRGARRAGDRSGTSTTSRPTNTASRTSPSASRTRCVGHAVRGDVPLRGDGRPRCRDRRRVAQGGLRAAVGGRDVEAHVRDGRARAVRLERRLHDGLRPARTPPPTPRPAPPSRSSSGRSGCSTSIATAAMPTSWSSPSTTAR